MLVKRLLEEAVKSYFCAFFSCHSCIFLKHLSKLTWRQLKNEKTLGDPSQTHLPMTKFSSRLFLLMYLIESSKYSCYFLYS